MLPPSNCKTNFCDCSNYFTLPCWRPRCLQAPRIYWSNKWDSTGCLLFYWMFRITKKRRKKKKEKKEREGRGKKTTKKPPKAAAPQYYLDSWKKLEEALRRFSFPTPLAPSWACPRGKPTANSRTAPRHCTPQRRLHNAPRCRTSQPDWNSSSSLPGFRCYGDSKPSARFELSDIVTEICRRKKRFSCCSVHFMVCYQNHPSILGWKTPKSPSDLGERRRLPYTQFLLYQNFSTTLLWTGIHLILSNASHKITTHPIYMVCHPPKLASPEQLQNAIVYILTCYYFSHLKNHSILFCKQLMKLSMPRCPSLQLPWAQNRELLKVTSLAWTVNSYVEYVFYILRKKNQTEQTCIFLILKTDKETTFKKIHNFYITIRFWNRHKLMNSALSFPKVSLTLQQCIYLHSQKGSFCMRSNCQQYDKLVCI